MFENVKWSLSIYGAFLGNVNVWGQCYCNVINTLLAAEIQYYTFMPLQMKRAVNRYISFFVSELIDISIMEICEQWLVYVGTPTVGLFSHQKPKVLDIMTSHFYHLLFRGIKFIFYIQALDDRPKALSTSLQDDSQNLWKSHSLQPNSHCKTQASAAHPQSCKDFPTVLIRLGNTLNF